jgi:hypothetical protein
LLFRLSLSLNISFTRQPTFASPLILLPYSDDQECQQHRVHDAHDSVEEAGDVIVLLALFGGHKALHHLQPGNCG